jgi:hypothetical protein
MSRQPLRNGNHLLFPSISPFDPNETSDMIATAEVLILIGENGGDPVFAHIAIIRALRPREPRAAPGLRRKRTKRCKIIV